MKKRGEPCDTMSSRPSTSSGRSGACSGVLRFYVPYVLPGLNEMIAQAKSRLSRGRKGTTYDLYKKQHTLDIVLACGGKRRRVLFSRVWINFHWRARDRRMDPDNIAAAKKYIIDALVTAGVIRNDGWDQIAGWTDSFSVDRKNPGCLVEVSEDENTK